MPADALSLYLWFRQNEETDHNSKRSNRRNGRLHAREQIRSSVAMPNAAKTRQADGGQGFAGDHAG